MHKVVLDGISKNMAYIAQLGKYGANNAADPTTMRYYVIKYLSEPYTLQEDHYLEAVTRRAGLEELAMILPP